MLASNIPTAANIIAYANIVRERSILRQLMNIGQTIADSAFNTNGRPSSELLDIAEQKIYQIAKTGQTTTFVDTSDLLSRLTDRMDHLSNNPSEISGLDTGFTELNKLTHGLQKSDLIIMAGIPGTGKTSFAMNLATFKNIEPGDFS